MRWSAPVLGVVICLSSVVARAGGLDVTHYDLAVHVKPERLEVEARLRLGPGALPDEATLELAAEMLMTGASCGDQAIPMSREGRSLVLDLRPIREVPEDERVLRVVVEGRPYLKFSPGRGGFVRTDVGASTAYIRSQYPWYPRLAGDRAKYRVSISAPEGWIAWTAGDPVPGSPGEFRSDHDLAAIGLIAGPYELVEAPEKGETPVGALVLRGHAGAARAVLVRVRTILSMYEEWFGAVSVRRFTVVEVPEAFGRGSGYGEAGYVLLGPGAFAGEPWAGSLLAHEIAHLWWGHAVAFPHFFSESLASYAALRWLEATAGAEAARRERRRAIERVAALRGGPRLEELRDFGAGMDPGVYRALAYEKGMMLLVMCEAGLGTEKVDAALGALCRSDVIGLPSSYDHVRKHMAKVGGRAGREVFDHWGGPGIPTLSETHVTTGGEGRFRTLGTLTQQGTTKPYRMKVVLRATGAGDPVETTVRITSRKASFAFTTPYEPLEIEIDPEWRLLVTRPTAATRDPRAVIDEAFRVVSNPGDGDREHCQGAIRLLEGLLATGAGEFESLCHTGIGRCLFRLGKHDAAQAEFEKALAGGAGGPFHRAWIHLRLGNMADLAKRRTEAEDHYRKVLAMGRGGHTAKLAKRFLERPYRGYGRDG